jgi:hypothetical protein
VLKRNVFINAGLGNQLFQYSYAHHNATNEDLSIYISVDSQPRQDRPFELNSLLEFCGHHQGSIKKTKGPVFLGRLRKISSRLLPAALHSLSSKILTPNFEENQFQPSSKKIINFGLIVGYFQHWRLVEESWPTFGPEINALVEKTSLGSFQINLSLQSPKPLVVAHVRRGDLVNLTSSMGVLDYPYYEMALKQIPMERREFHLIVVTDDVTGAKSITDLLLPDEVLGPDELNPLQTLSLMALSDFVISANSTLSWWGGYLAFKRGASTFIPYPWFKNWKPDVGTAFNFPGFKILSASFIAPGKFQSDFTLES